MPSESHDAYKPAEIAALIETAGVAKAALPLHRMATLAMLAGAFIGFGAAAYTMVMTGADPGFGPSRLLGGLTFSLGLMKRSAESCGRRPRAVGILGSLPAGG